MSSAESILLARESRHAIVADRARYSDVLTIKANIPGQNKNIAEASLIVSLFAKQTEKYCGESITVCGEDGVAVIADTIKGAKGIAVTLENKHPLGRFVDIDVTLKGQTDSESRGIMRKCYICDDYAFVCARRKRHSYSQLMDVVTSNTRDYFSQQLSYILKKSMMAELDLEDKFGLVTKSNSGSHCDMDYSTMKTSQDVVIPYLVEMFWIGVDNGTNNILPLIQAIGINAEKAMMQATGNVNTYKGLIFVAGVLLAAVGAAVVHCEESVWDISGRITKDILLDICRHDTFGAYAYKTFNIGGAREQAMQGFPAVNRACKLLVDMNDKTLLRTLIAIVADIDDTVLLKRSGSWDKYLYYKNLIASVDINNTSALSQVNKQCVDNGISIGGSADILVAAIMLNKISDLVSLNAINRKKYFFKERGER